MIDLTLNSFLHPDLVGLQPPFGTIIEWTAENKGGLSTAQTDNNMAMPFALMRPVTVATSDTTSKVEYDAKLLLTGDTPLTIHIDDATYDGCTVTIVNGSSAQATLVAVAKLNGINGGKFKLAIGRIAVITWKAGWVTLQETTSEGAFSAPPLDFIYPQFRGEKDPNALFPGTTWENISNQHAGRFFRVEGGNAASFGGQQDDMIRSHSHSISLRVNWMDAYESPPYHISGREHTFLGYYYAATDASGGAETRPVNETMRIWKRTG